jgi:uncharacterized membrane protein
MFKISQRSAVLAAGSLAALLALGAFYDLWLSPGARVKATVEKTTKAFWAKDRVLILENIGHDFYCHPFDKAKADTALNLFFREFEKVRVTSGGHKIKVTGDEAVDTIGVIVLVSRGGEQGFILGSFGNPVPLTLKLKKRKKWQIIGVEGLKTE